LVVSPFTTAFAATGLRAFLRAQLRDNWIDRGLMVITAVALSALGCLAIEPLSRALELSLLITLSCSVVAFWLCLRAWMLGDSFAMPMSVAAATLIFVAAGIYGMSSGLLSGAFFVQAIFAALAALYVVLATLTIDRRHAAYLRMRRALEASRDRDLLTQVWTGAALVRKVDDAIVRAKRYRKSMAVMCVELYNAGKLRQEFGQHGADEVIYLLAAKLRHKAGADAIVGRYSDTSFIVVLNSVRQDSVIRSFGLKLAAAVRKPITVKPQSIDPRQFRADIGLGVARINASRQSRQRMTVATEYGGFDGLSIAQDALHEAAELAMAARRFPSRSAIMDDKSKEAIALENAKF
jgi:diguanylate cyclase (GGDEF)-like protein